MYDPQRYETNKATAGRDVAEYVPKLIDGMHWKDNEQILDFGCGAGSVCHNYFVPMAKKHYSKVDAVDISEEMIRYAKATHAHELVQFYQGNILADEFVLHGNTYDRIFSIYVLHFIKDFKSAFQKFSELLKPGGELGFIVVGKSRIFSFLEILGRNPKWSAHMEGYEQFVPTWHEQDADAEELLRNALIEAGFVIKNMRTDSRSFEHDFEVSIDFYMSLNPYLKRIPTELLPALKEEYRSIVRRPDSSCTNSTDSSRFIVNYSTVFCIATKPI